MNLEEIREELVLLKATLIDDELGWTDEQVEAEWEVRKPLCSIKTATH